MSTALKINVYEMRKHIGMVSTWPRPFARRSIYQEILPLLMNGPVSEIEEVLDEIVWDLLKQAAL